MAARRKKASAAELAGHEDPRAPLDGAALLAAAKPLLTELAADLLKRADESAPVTAALKARHAAEQKAERTADGYPEWRRNFVEQVAAAWLLSCVFARTLEDRGLLGRNRIAGTGAEDSWKAFLQLAPSLSEREYLLTVFRELSRLPAAADLFDVRHNPVWLLAPSADGSRKLLELFRSPTADAPAFRFGGDDTRFLGDLYQDLSEAVRKQYALLQTPRFVERFILDRTLEPAIERFGLSETTLIDPTCGSGHFLLGAFERLFDRRLQVEPALSPREAATKALDAVAGADINPYAIAIARFRLTLAFVEKCGVRKLKDAPRLPLHLAVADSLLYNAQIGQLALVEGTSPAAWEGAHFALEDPAAARDVLFKQYAAVVGNPPYITVKDAVLRERYRASYSSAFRSYSLGVPFTERFFQLGREGGFVGMITANSFMKREFGKLLIEQCLPTVNLELIVNTSGAYIPGHGTPTVLLFGTRERGKGADVLTVLANRGEPTTLEDAEKGLVWSSIAAHWKEAGFENEYISVARVGRASLAKHPWSLGGGGAGELKELLEERASTRLRERVDAIGRSTHTGEDSFFFMPREAAERLGVDRDRLVPLVTGEQVRDWAIFGDQVTLFPYDPGTAVAAVPAGREGQLYWAYRTTLRDRQDYGEKIEARGLTWFEHSMFFPERFLRPLSITFAEVATHNHFVLDRGGKVFKQTAPAIKLSAGATEEEHLALLGYLNTSLACFWMKQVCHRKSSASQKHHADPARAAYAFSGTAISDLPLASSEPEVVVAARRLDAEAMARGEWLSGSRFRRDAHSLVWSRDAIRTYVDSGWGNYESATARAAYLQEELDWAAYVAFGLVTRQEADLRLTDAGVAPLGSRPFEQASGYDPGLSARVREETDAAKRVAGPPHWQKRLPLLERADLRVLESREFKRMWRDTEQNVSQQQFRREAAAGWMREHVADLAERRISTDTSPQTATTVGCSLQLADALPAIAEYLQRDSAAFLAAQLEENAVPYLAALRYSEKGFETWSQWNEVWALQRREDRGQRSGSVKPAPKYGQDDFRSTTFWALRGKLDVPKERFISYPGCESHENPEPVYGWAGWDHLQRAVALAGLYQDRKRREGWPKDRLMPMLAGLLELLPWLKQWHHDPSVDLGGERPSDQFEAFIGAECAEYGWTHDDLSAWRLEARSGARRSKRNNGVEL